LVGLQDGQVTFTYKDYAGDSKQRRLTLPADEFLRRFLQHVLPKGFVKVRHYGLLANGQRQGKLALCRWLLALAAVVMAVLTTARVTLAERRCPECGVGRMGWVEDLPRPARPAAAARASSDDTS
jgi:hypothetical protein